MEPTKASLMRASKRRGRFSSARLVEIRVPSDTHLPRAGHDVCVFPRHTPPPLIGEFPSLLPTAKIRAYAILSEFEQAQAELVGNAVITKAKTPDIASLARATLARKRS